MGLSQQLSLHMYIMQNWHRARAVVVRAGLHSLTTSFWSRPASASAVWVVLLAFN